MKANHLIIGCFLLTLSSCITLKTNKMQSNNIDVIEGVAQDAKAGAVIVANDSDVYYIDGMEYWRSKYLNKKIAVTGFVVEVKGSELSDSTLVTQNIPSKKIIRNAKYKLIKK